MDHLHGREKVIDLGRIAHERMTGEDLARRFQMRVIELAKEGTLGTIKTRNSALRSSYVHLLSLVDHAEIPILFYGEKGSGKRRHIEEFFTIQSVFRRLMSLPQGRLRVFRSDFLSPGFATQFLVPHSSAGDLIYIDGIERLSLAMQDELLQHLKLRKQLGDQGVELPRLILGTERALSILVLKSEFRRELFQAITGFAVFLPSLNERSEDYPHLLQAFSQEYTGKAQTPPTWLVDLLGHHTWCENIDELKTMLKNGFARTKNFSEWTEADLPAELRPLAPQSSTSSFRVFDAEEARRLADERTKLKKALVANGGHHEPAARAMGVSKSAFLSLLLRHGLR